MRKPKIQDLADRARVSPATVSRVINGRPHVSREKQERVVQAMKAMGFPQEKALIALIVPDSSNPFFSDLAFAFEHVLEEYDAHLLVSSSEGRLDRELELVHRFRELKVRGLIYTSTGSGAGPILEMIAEGFPVVVFDRRILSGNLDTVTVNSRHGTQCAVDYLFASGHRKIGYIKGLEGTETANERYESYCEAMSQNRLDPGRWIFEGDYTLASGRSCAERLIEMDQLSRPTAILAANDLMAIGLMQRLQQEGWSLPRNLSVIGFDDIQWSQWVHPALTTIAQPISKLVREAASKLMKRAQEFDTGAHPRRRPETIEISPKLIPRESVAEPFDWGAGPRVVG